MPRLLILAALAATLLFAACGSGSDETTAGASARADTVSTKHVDGIGDVLVDSGGRALYTPDQEADGKIRCTDGCTSFWLPLDAGSGAPTGPGKLGVVRRPDGARQVTMDGKPLYTFTEDSAGKVTGDGFKDAFGGQTFTWHVVLAGGGSTDAGSNSDAGGAGGYGY